MPLDVRRISSCPDSKLHDRVIIKATHITKRNFPSSLVLTIVYQLIVRWLYMSPSPTVSWEYDNTVA